MLLQYAVNFTTGTSGLKMGIFWQTTNEYVSYSSLSVFAIQSKIHLDMALSREVGPDGIQKFLST